MWHWWNDERVAWLFWPGLVAVGLALIAWLGDHRRRHRAEPDAVGFVPWTTVFVLASLAALILLGFAVRAGMK
jgi:hypothetical protein